MGLRRKGGGKVKNKTKERTPSPTQISLFMVAKLILQGEGDGIIRFTYIIYSGRSTAAASYADTKARR